MSLAVSTSLHYDMVNFFFMGILFTSIKFGIFSGSSYGGNMSSLRNSPCTRVSSKYSSKFSCMGVRILWYILCMLVWYLKNFITYGLTPFLTYLLYSICNFLFKNIAETQKNYQFTKTTCSISSLRKTKEEEEIYLDAISAFYSALNQNDW